MTATTRTRPMTVSWQNLVTPALPAFLGLAILAAPTLVSVARKSWPTEQGQYGPAVLGLGIWLLYRDRGKAAGLAAPGGVLTAGLLIALGAELYVVARLADQYIVETFALAWLALATLYALYGGAWLEALWFPLGFMVLAAPAPFSLTFPIASHLRLWISMATVDLLQLCHLNIVRDGLNISIDQYTLVMAEACSGMNSLISLSAIGLLYLHIRRNAGPLRLLAMAPAIIAFAILGNFARVVCLVVFTHVFGDRLTQSVLHEATGIVTFAVALLGVVAVDEAVFAARRFKAPRFWRRRRRR